MKSLFERFMAKVQMKPHWCWLWTGAKKNGYEYGFMNIKGKIHSSHRLSYSFFVGKIPDGLCILHSCDNPSCVNPDHLFSGTHRDNMQDAAQKGRLATGDRHGSKTHPEKIPRGDNHWTRLYSERVPWKKNPPKYLCNGEKSGMTKLNNSKVLDMRKLREEGAELRELGEKFSVSLSSVSLIVNRKRWTHI